RKGKTQRKPKPLTQPKPSPTTLFPWPIPLTRPSRPHDSPASQHGPRTPPPSALWTLLVSSTSSNTREHRSLRVPPDGPVPHDRPTLAPHRAGPVPQRPLSCVALHYAWPTCQRWAHPSAAAPRHQAHASAPASHPALAGPACQRAPTPPRPASLSAPRSRTPAHLPAPAASADRPDPLNRVIPFPSPRARNGSPDP